MIDAIICTLYIYRGEQLQGLCISMYSHGPRGSDSCSYTLMVQCVPVPQTEHPLTLRTHEWNKFSATATLVSASISLVPLGCSRHDQFFTPAEDVSLHSIVDRLLLAGSGDQLIADWTNGHSTLHEREIK